MRFLCRARVAAAWEARGCPGEMRVFGSFRRCTLRTAIAEFAASYARKLAGRNAKPNKLQRRRTEAVPARLLTPHPSRPPACACHRRPSHTCHPAPPLGGISELPCTTNSPTSSRPALCAAHCLLGPRHGWPHHARRRIRGVQVWAWWGSGAGLHLEPGAQQSRLHPVTAAPACAGGWGACSAHPFTCLGVSRAGTLRAPPAWLRQAPGLQHAPVWLHLPYQGAPFSLAYLCRRLGFNVFLSGIAPLIINGTFSEWWGRLWLRTDPPLASCFGLRVHLETGPSAKSQRHLQRLISESLTWRCGRFWPFASWAACAPYETCAHHQRHFE